MKAVVNAFVEVLHMTLRPRDRKDPDRCQRGLIDGQLRRLRFRAEDPVQLHAEEIAQLLLYQGLFLFLSGHSDQQNQPHTNKTKGGEQKDVPKYEGRDRRTDQQDDAQQDTDILNELTAPQFLESAASVMRPVFAVSMSLRFFLISVPPCVPLYGTARRFLPKKLCGSAFFKMIGCMSGRRAKSPKDDPGDVVRAVGETARTGSGQLRMGSEPPSDSQKTHPGTSGRCGVHLGITDEQRIFRRYPQG